jgi:hypothetical protein
MFTMTSLQLPGSFVVVSRGFQWLGDYWGGGGIQAPAENILYILL